jgi:uncharacterized protein YhhL (DUF1145 family)
MKEIKFIIINVLTLFIMLVLWYFACFSLGYASNSEHQKEILIAYIVTVFMHFIISYFIYKKEYASRFAVWYLLLNIPLYIFCDWYLYNNT